MVHFREVNSLLGLLTSHFIIFHSTLQTHLSNINEKFTNQNINRTKLRESTPHTQKETRNNWVETRMKHHPRYLFIPPIGEQTEQFFFSQGQVWVDAVGCETGRIVRRGSDHPFYPRAAGRVCQSHDLTSAFVGAAQILTDKSCAVFEVSQERRVNPVTCVSGFMIS